MSADKLAKSVRKGAQLTGLAALRWARDQALETYEQGRRVESLVSAEKALRTAITLGKEIDTLVEAEAARSAADPSKMSEEEFVGLFREKVTGLPTPYLELAVAEYLQRHPGMELRQP